MMKRRVHLSNTKKLFDFSDHFTPNITVTDEVAPTEDLQVPFGDITVGSASDQSVTVANVGDVDLLIGTIALANSIVAPFSTMDDLCSGQTLAPAGNCTLTVRFSPTATGHYTDSFDIPSDDPDENPVTVSVNGTGTTIPVPDIIVTDGVAPVIDLQVPFGNVTVGNTLDKTVTIKNDGNANLIIGMIGQNTPLAAPFSILNDTCSGLILAQTETCTLDVRFLPDVTGTINDIFDIPSNDPDEKQVTVNVSGTGLSAVTNNPPSIPELVFPANGQTGLGPDVTLGWNNTTDPDGDSVNYNVNVCEDASFAGCDPIDVAKVETKAASYVGLGLGMGLILGVVMIGGFRGRRKAGLFIASMMAAGLLLVSCGGGGGDKTPSQNDGGGNPAADLTKTVTGLKPGTTYHWIVIVSDGLGGKTESESRRFTTQ